MATLEIRLDRHIGKQTTPFGVIDVDLGQFFVMAKTIGSDENWVHLGYICEPSSTNPRPPFNGLELFRTLPQQLKDEVVQIVSKKLGLANVRRTEIPEPVAILDETYDEEDDVESEG